MKPHLLSIGWACCMAVSSVQPLLAEDAKPESFRAILELSDLVPDALAQLGEGPEYSDKDWQTLLQVFSRLQQFRDLQASKPLAPTFPETWLAKRESGLGDLFDIEGQILSVEKLPLPEKLAKSNGLNEVYRCQFNFQRSSEAIPAVTTVLTAQIPKDWQSHDNFSGSVRLRGALIQLLHKDSVWQPLVLTNHIAWYPIDGVPTGKLLLARHGMDVTLFDEVRHRQPFVKPEVSREGEAFYAALNAMRQSNPQEIAKLAKENVAQEAEQWQARQPELRREHRELEAELATTTDSAVRVDLEKKVKLAKNQRGLAATVVKQAEAGQSSVAPMFLQPEEVVGELFTFEGTARRAVRIAVEPPNDMESYYELEVYPAESRLLRHQPVVCCVTKLPTDFPTGDEIREPVRISGVFFKLWRYRSRKLSEPAGQTTGQRQLYTLSPVVLGNAPTWLSKSTHNNSRWAVWGGIAFLGVLATLWISLSWLAKRDRQARAKLRRTNEIIDL